MKLKFESVIRRPVWEKVASSDWADWKWQIRSGLKTQKDFETAFVLTEAERALFQQGAEFAIRTTPYYASLARSDVPMDPLRRIQLPHSLELSPGLQAMKDPLGEEQHRPCRRVIHRYPDRVLLLVTDFCGMYCRFCLRKHFTATDQMMIDDEELNEALAYIQSKKGIREVILSGGDPLTLSDSQLVRVLEKVRAIDHVEILRIGSRMPVINPFRVTVELSKMLRSFAPVFVMSHFNHPRELTEEAAAGISNLVDHGVPVFNQSVLLNGVNNSVPILQALSRRLLYLRAKPYYLFQCDPSRGTDHFRTSVEQTESLQKEMWGAMSGLAMPNFSLDIPMGGGKVGLVPNFEIERSATARKYKGWDGKVSEYINPPQEQWLEPIDTADYLSEWQ